MKVRIFGVDDETLMLSKRPNQYIVGVGQTLSFDMRRTWIEIKNLIDDPIG